MSFNCGLLKVDTYLFCTACPDGVPTVFCLVNPCQLATCEVKGAECVPDYCGACNAKWYLDRQEITSLCSGIIVYAL